MLFSGGNVEPDDYDFSDFFFIIGMISQVSDVPIFRRHLRRFPTM